MSELREAVNDFKESANEFISVADNVLSLQRQRLDEVEELQLAAEEYLERMRQYKEARQFAYADMCRRYAKKCLNDALELMPDNPTLLAMLIEN